jgi:transposase
MPFGKVLVAIANKHARQIWAMLAHDVDYDPHAWVKHPKHPLHRHNTMRTA